MSLISHATLLRSARFAISAHNVQPFRFRFTDDEVQVFVAPENLLPAADPHEKDLRMSLGALIETWRIALSSKSLGLQLQQAPPSHWQDGQPYAVLKIQKSSSSPDPLADFLEKRFSYRGSFPKVPESQLAPTKSLLEKEGFRVVTEKPKKKLVARLYQKINLSSLLREGYVEELYSWLRFKPNHPRWSRDGLNVQALSLSNLEAVAASKVLNPKIFRFLDRMKLAGPLVDETPKIMSAPWVAAIVCSKSASDVEKGEIFLRKWLELAQMNLFGAPLSLLTDSEEIMEELRPVFGVSAEETFVNVLRIGLLPAGYQRPPTARLPDEDLLWKA